MSQFDTPVWVRIPSAQVANGFEYRTCLPAGKEQGTGEGLHTSLFDIPCLLFDIPTPAIANTILAVRAFFS
jgi:hypothetical protein